MFQIDAFVTANQDHHLNELNAFLRIPSVGVRPRLHVACSITRALRHRKHYSQEGHSGIDVLLRQQLYPR
jgi:hypothetical protein